MEIETVDGFSLRPKSRTQRHDVATVTPALAQHWLATQTRNRNEQRTACAAYRADMIAGRWEYTGDPIRFDWDGHLIDGQNRLTALAGIEDPDFSLPFLVIRGLPPESQMVMDQGARRTAGQQLGLKGLTSATNLAAGIRMMLRWERGLLFNNGDSQKVVTTTEVSRWVDEHPAQMEMVARYVHPVREIKLRPSAGLAFVLRMDTAMDDQVWNFFSEMHTMVNLEEGSPTLALAKRLARVRQDADLVLSEIDQLGFLVYTWNNWMRGVSASRLNRPKNGWHKDNFPVPVGMPEQEA